MTSPFEPPVRDRPVEPPPLRSHLDDPWVVTAAVLVLVYGIPILLIAPLFPVVGAIGGALDPDFRDVPMSWALMGCVGGVEGLCIGAVGLLYVAAGAGLLTGRKWGWVLGLVVYGLWLTNLCCAPFGVLGMVALLRRRVREVYGVG